MTHLQTPAQTIGPFFHRALIRGEFDDADPDGVAGAPIRLTGVVLDARGEKVDDAMLEFWQTDGRGHYRHPLDPHSDQVPEGFIGFGRVQTDHDGRYVLDTAMPGRSDTSGQAPHLCVQVFARGLLDLLTTRVYFEGHLDDDPVLASLPDERKPTLVARRAGDDGRRAVWEFDVRLAGDDETVFFDV